MKTPTNSFKRALAHGEQQIGLWLGLADSYAAELLAGTGYDWLLVDGEHAPNDLRSVMRQLQAVASGTSALETTCGPQPIVRVAEGTTTLLKQYLDIGAQTILVPMVDDALRAAEIARAVRYPPQGNRGLGSALARASRWQAYPDYLSDANAQICLLVQAETVTAMQNLDAIAATEGVDGVFIGPADLAASMGFIGHPMHPGVQLAIRDGIARIRRAGKAAGVLSTNEAQARQWLDAGALFVAVGIDTALLRTAAMNLLAKFRPVGTRAPVSGY